MSTAVLVGNGLSISYNAELSVPRLTDALLGRFVSLGGSLAEMANEIAKINDERGFEDLLGPFDAVSAMIQSLPGLVVGRESTKEFRALAQALEATREIHGRGIAVALQLIGERSHVKGDFDAVDSFCSAVAALDDPGNLCIGTLNYDGLLTAGFLNEVVHLDWVVNKTLTVSDMGDGRLKSVDQTDFSGERPLESWHLRSTPDFMAHRARLLNLHGSLGWLRDRKDPSDVRRFRIPDLRELDFWTQYERGETSWEPVVVLTSRKTELVREWPFVLAYAEFEQALTDADRWLIAGYGFGDDAINQMFRRAASARKGHRRTTDVLVIGNKNRLRLTFEALRSLRLPFSWLRVSDAGLPDAVNGQAWADWAS